MTKPRDEASRRALYAAIETAMERYPDMRVGQLVVNAVRDAERIFNVENDDLTAAILALAKNRR